MMTKDRIIHELATGLSQAEVSRKLGIDPSYVCRVAQAAGFAKALPHAPLRLDRERARQLYEAGCVDTEIARQLGVHSGTVRVWRQALQLPAVVPPRVGIDIPFSPTTRAILKAVRRGSSYGDVAAACGVTRNVVAGVMYRAKRNGVFHDAQSKNANGRPG